jgi:hypothetical protein
LHQVGDLFEFNVKLRCQNVNFFFFFTSTTLYEFWLAQLFLSVVSSLAPSVSNTSLPSFSGHFSLRLPTYILPKG